MRDLAAIQQRFYELATAGEGTIDPGLLGSSRRLDVYAGMYITRLHDILADDYPKLRAALGELAFHDVVTTYVRAAPPTSFTVRNAGVALAEFLETRNDVPAWSADLARLERARVEVFDGPDAATLTRDDLTRVPFERFPEIKLAWIPACVRVTSSWTVDELWDAIEEDRTFEAPLRDERTVLVWRRDLRVVHRTLDADEAHLAPLVATAATLEQVSEHLLAFGGDGPETRIVELLERWLDADVLSSSELQFAVAGAPSATR